MRAWFAVVALAFASSASVAGPEERAKMHLTSDSYTVTWGAAAAFDPGAESEIGDGNGHGGTLNWTRFRPVKNGVEVLSIRFDEGWEPYDSKWPPDRAPVTVKRAVMKPEVYAALLRDFAVVNAARLKPVQQKSVRHSSNDFWVSARVTSNKKTLVDLDWAGYEVSSEEVNFAKPLAANALAAEATRGLDFKEHALTDEERRWAATKFVRDWKAHKDSKPHWWVRNRSIITIGVVGDATVFPTLREILGGDPKGQGVYHAINAITRLTKTDVRDKPVEAMDVEKVRGEVLDLIKDKN